MKHSRRDVNCKAYAIPEIQFETQSMTAYAGLLVLQLLITRLGLTQRLRWAFQHNRKGKIYRPDSLFLWLVIHLFLGYRELRDARCYRDDPLVRRLLGLKQIPDVATLSRMLKEVDQHCVDNVRQLLNDLVLRRLGQLTLEHVTLDFDGSVQSTKAHAEGTAVGFNKKKKGARSYYPLFCTIPQTGQVFDVLHRCGNVHDSNGARAFIRDCVSRVQTALPGIRIEVRMDSAFFSDEIIDDLHQHQPPVEFTVSTPFERFTELKAKIKQRQRWNRLSDDVSYFEFEWKPQCWDHQYRFIAVKTRQKKQHKGPIQLNLFEPYEYGYDFKVIVTNKLGDVEQIIPYHEGRGSQEKIFAELKTHCGVDYIPVRKRTGNELYLLAGLLTHNLARELQMQMSQPERTTSPKRPTLWKFQDLKTLRQTLIHHVGRITHPQRRMTLIISMARQYRDRFLGWLQALQQPA